MAARFGSTGNPTSTGPSLFGSSTPAFGSSSQAFGAASSSPSLFGGAFGTPASSVAQTPSLFGSSSGGLFGASSGVAFGASSQPSLFGQANAASQAGLLSFNTPASTPSLFGAQSSAAAQGSSLFGGSFGQTTQQPAANPGGIATTDNKTITHYTRWSDINVAGQTQLLELEKRIMQTKEESRQLHACERLRHGPLDDPGDAEAGPRHCLKGVVGSRHSDDEALSVLSERVQDLLRSTEIAVRTFERAYTWREVAKMGQRQVIPAAIRDLINSPVILPSHFLAHAIDSFKETIQQCQVVVTELDRMLSTHQHIQRSELGTDQAHRVVEMLPSTLRNNEDYIMRVAAKISRLNDTVALIKDKFLDARRQEGDCRDPFKEAERKEKLQALDSDRAKQRGIPLAAGYAMTPSTPGSAQNSLQLTSGQPGAGQQAAVPSLFTQASNPFGGMADSSSKQGGSRKTRKR